MGWGGGSGLGRGGYNISLTWNENTQHFEVGTGQVWDRDKGESAEQHVEVVEREREYRERRDQLEQRQPGVAYGNGPPGESGR